MTDPHGARISVRLAQYPNQAAEDAAVASVDKQVFDRVRGFERILVGQARAFQYRASVARQQAADAAADLSEFIRDLEVGRISLDEDTARRYERLRNEGQATAAHLRAAVRESAFHERRAADPYSQYVDLLRRFPALRRDI